MPFMRLYGRAGQFLGPFGKPIFPTQIWKECEIIF